VFRNVNIFIRVAHIFCAAHYKVAHCVIHQFVDFLPCMLSYSSDSQSAFISMNS